MSAICDERLRFLKSLKTWDVFGKGWGRRVGEVKATALEMAMPSAKAQPTKPVTPTKAGGAAIAAGAGVAAAHQAGLPIGLVVVLAAAAALGALLLVHYFTGKD